MREDGAWLAGKAAVPTDDATNDVLALEPEALEMADSQGRGSGAGLDTDPSGHHHGTTAPVIATADGAGGGTVR